MAGSVNKVILVGNLGNDPDIRTMQSGGRVANLSIATSESWKDKSGERQERTEWHRVVIFNDNLVNLAQNYLRKGSKVYLEGQLETRKWQDQNGQDKYSTEVVLRPYRGELTMLDSRSGGQSGNAGGGYDNSNDFGGGYGQQGGGQGGMSGGGAPARAKGNAAPALDEFEDEIPF